MASPDTPTPRWVIEIAAEPQSEAERERLHTMLPTLLYNHSGLSISLDRETGQIIFRGTSEQQLDSAISELKRHDIGVKIGAPQIAYRERITRQVTHEYVHKQQSGGSGQFAGVRFVVEPLPLGTTPSFRFENQIIGEAVPKEFIPGVEKGLESVLNAGVLAGYPIADLKVTLIDGKYHDVDSSALAFEVASRMGLREALQRGDPVLLEPIMAVEVTTPVDSESTVIRDLESRGRVRQRDIRDDVAIVRATVALANLLGYEKTLRSLTHGRATFLVRFDHYAPVPPSDDPPFRPAIGMRP